MVDSALIIVSTILTVVLAAIGFEVTAHPPAGRRKVWAYRVAIIILGIGMITVNVTQNRRDSNARLESENRRHQDQIDNLRALNNMQARLETVGELVRDYAKSSPPSEKTKHLADTVSKLAAPNPPTDLRVVAY